MAEETLDMNFRTNGKEFAAELNSAATAADKASKKFDLLGAVSKDLDQLLGFIRKEVDELKSAYARGEVSADVFSKTLNGMLKNYKDLYNIQSKVLGQTENLTRAYRKQNEVTGGRQGAGANRFVSSNVMAQLQDIVVTSQMGMNPLTIAMQQGTQLMSAFAQSKDVLADLKAGFAALIGPVALLTVGITALVAKGIQMVDWASVAQGLLNGLANVFEFIGNHITELVVGFGSLISVELIFNDTLRDSLILSLTKFAGQIKNLYTLLVANFAPAMKKAITAISAFFTPIRIARTAVAVFTTALAFLGDKVLGTNVFNKLSNWFHEIAEEIGLASNRLEQWNNILDDFDKKTEDLTFERSLIGLDTYTKAYKTATRELQQAFSEQKAELIAKGASEEEISNFEKEISLIDEKAKKRATEISLNEKANDAYRDGQKAIEDYNRALKNLSGSYDNLALSYQTKIEDLDFKNSLKGLTEEEQIVARINNDYEKQIKVLERKAVKDGVDISKFQEKINNIEKQKNALIDLQVETYKNEEAQKAWNSAMDYGASLTKSFFSDLKSGLQEGQSAWEAFTNAVLKMLDKIADKMMDLAIDAAFDSLKQGGAGKSSSGNLFSSLMNIGASLFSSGGGQMFAFNAAETAAMSSAAQASGQVVMTDAMYMAALAKGGAFTNGIYNSPTMFKFGKGNKFGVMGEAGPEAVVPLHRGSDGSLGIRADGMGGSSPVVVNVINNSNARATTQQRQTEQGTTIDVMIDEMVAQKLGKQGTASNQALTAFNNRQLIAR